VIPNRLLAHRRITESGCWEWTRSRTEHGYGRVSWHNKPRRVHRVIAHLVYGLDLDDSEQKALHRCDNPPCFNPAHLYIGSQKANVADMVSRGRWAGGGKPHEVCAQGHPLTDDNVKIGRGGGRRCRTCACATQREYYRRRKARQGAFWRPEPTSTLDALENKEA
jgi:hypothetical protein